MAPLALTFLILRRKPRLWGFYGGILCAFYAPLRFLLDFLRERSEVLVPGVVATADARYLGLTPAQWACLPLFALGVALLVRLPTQGREPPPAPAAFFQGDPPGSNVDREGAAGDARDER